MTGRGCPSSSRRNEKKKNTTGRAVPSLSCPNEKDATGRGYAPPCRVEMRATTRGGGGTPLLFTLKWKEHDEEGVCAPLLVASKRKLEHNREGQRPPHHVEMARTRRRGAYPSSSCQKGNENTTGRTPGPLRRVQVARTRRGGHTPPRRVKKETKTRMGRAPALPVVLKW